MPYVAFILTSFYPKKNNNLYIIDLIAVHTLFVCLSKKTCQREKKIIANETAILRGEKKSQFDYFPLSFSPTFDPWRSRRPVINVTLFMRMNHPNAWWRKKIQKSNSVSAVDSRHWRVRVAVTSSQYRWRQQTPPTSTQTHQNRPMSLVCLWA